MSSFALPPAPQLLVNGYPTPHNLDAVFINYGSVTSTFSDGARLSHGPNRTIARMAAAALSYKHYDNLHAFLSHTLFPDIVRLTISS